MAEVYACPDCGCKAFSILLHRGVDGFECRECGRRAELEDDDD